MKINKGTHTYRVNPEFILANTMQEDSLYDADTFKYELFMLKKLGLHGWLTRNGYSYKALCDYFTKMVGTLNPITAVEVI